MENTHPEQNRARHATLCDIERLIESADQLGLSAKAVERLRWFAYAMQHDGNVRKTCAHFGISPSTFTRWAKRFEYGNPATLENHSKQPHKKRRSAVPEKVIALIRTYREEEPQIGREDIQRKLQEEHSVILSASSIGRVIRRQGFFFADTPSHWLKRAAKHEQEVCEEHLADRMVEEQLRATPDAHSTLSALADEEKQKKAEEKKEGGNSALKAIIFFVATSIVAAGALAGGRTALAMEGSSYRLYGEFQEKTASDPLSGSSYRMEEGSITTTEKPLTGTNYQIVSAPPTAAAASSSSSSAGGAEGAGGAGAGHGGGRRTIPDIAKEKQQQAEEKAGEKGGTEQGEERFAFNPRGILHLPPSGRKRVLAAVPTVQLPTAAAVPSPVHPSVFSVVDLLNPCAWLTFFDSREHLGPCAVHYAPGETIGTVATWSGGASMLVILLLSIVLGCLGAILFVWEMGMYEGLFLPSPTVRMPKRWLWRVILVVIAAAILALSFFGISTAIAKTTTPLNHTYHGHLLDSSGDAVTSAVTIRFSYWNSADYVSGDVTATGAINTGASTYVGWTEEHTVTPNSDGYFSVKLGSGTALPTMDSLNLSTLLSLYLQVEVKASSAADTSYDLLDDNTSNDAVDRSPVLSVPFALNADMLDQRDTGTASGSIAVLQAGGVFPKSTIPSGTTQSGFTLDTGNAATGDITLQFGTSLAKKLVYSQSNNYFDFNDDVNIQGDLTVTGLVNGIDITNLQSATGALKVSSGAGLNVNIDGGSYRVSGNRTDFAGDSTVSVVANTTNYVFFTSTGTQVNETGFPTNHSHIPLAEVVTNGAGVTNVQDRRVLLSDDRERTIVRTYHAGFEGASYQGDASNNVGQLYIDHDNTTNRNYYRWSSSLSSLQDYDIFLRTTLPEDFVRWSTGSGNFLRVSYRSTSADTNDNQLDISVFDTNGSPVTLSGSSASSGLDLAGTSWQTEQIEWTGTPTWTAGRDFLIKLKLHAKNDEQMHVGDLILQYVELPSE